MKRTAPRPDWGWENAFDLYLALERAIPSTTITLARAAGPRDPSPGWSYSILAGRIGSTYTVSERDLTMFPVAEIAARVAAWFRAEIERLYAADRRRGRMTFRGGKWVQE